MIINWLRKSAMSGRHHAQYKLIIQNLLLGVTRLCKPWHESSCSCSVVCEKLNIFLWKKEERIITFNVSCSQNTRWWWFICDHRSYIRMFCLMSEIKTIEVIMNLIKIRSISGIVSNSSYNNSIDLISILVIPVCEVESFCVFWVLDWPVILCHDKNVCWLNMWVKNSRRGKT